MFLFSEKQILLLILIFSFGKNINATEKIDNQTIKKCYYDSYELEKQSRYIEAMKALNLVKENYPNGYTVNYRLGWLSYKNGNFADAIKYYNTALSASTSSVEILNSKILIYVAKKDWKNVEAEALKVRKIDYYNSSAAYWYVLSLRIQKKYPEAIKALVEYLTFFPTSTVMLTELGEAYYEKGEMSTAMEVFNSVIILDPYNQTATKYLHKKGDK